MATSPLSPSRLPPRIEELRLLEIAQELPGDRIGGVSQGRGQATEAMARDRASASSFCWYLDGYQAELAKEHLEQPDSLRILCQADWPAEEIDLALVPLSKGGEAELSREILQSAYDQLAIGGWLVASVDNPRDRWLHEHLKNYTRSVRVRPFPDATVYLVEKLTPLKKRKDFSCTVAYRDCEETLHMVTRPGIFAHRELDAGARQILDAVDVYPEARILDIGCGGGAICLGLAKRDASATVHAFDSNARAIQCLRTSLQLNKLTNLVADHHWKVEYRQPNEFDMAVANPPYYADFRIATRFIETALRSLRPAGRLVVVTKQPRWYEEHLGEYMHDVEVFPSKRYFIASGVKPD